MQFLVHVKNKTGSFHLFPQTCGTHICRGMIIHTGNEMAEAETLVGIQ
jgi:hypothetical protein